MNPDKIVIGTCDGTGAIINVCLGFIPKYVKLFNLEDSHSKFPSVEWWNPDMLAIAAFVGGVEKLTGTTYRQIAALTTAGLAPYAGGDKICFLSATHPHWVDVGATADVSEKYVDGSYRRLVVGDTAFKCIGDKILGKTPVAADYGAIVTTPAGFIINIEAVINVDGEQLMWHAIG